MRNAINYEAIDNDPQDGQLDSLLDSDPVAEMFIRDTASRFHNSHGSSWRDMSPEEAEKILRAQSALRERERERILRDDYMSAEDAEKVLHPHEQNQKHEEKIDMSKPWIHAVSSAKIYGGKPEDYLAIHEFMDSSKATMSDNRHRALTHNTWFITTILHRIFGSTIKNSDGNAVPVRDIGEQHCLEDFGGRFVPTVQDYLGEMDSKPWMSNEPDFPPSSRRVAPKQDQSQAPYVNPAHASSYHRFNPGAAQYPIAID